MTDVEKQELAVAIAQGVTAAVLNALEASARRGAEAQRNEEAEELPEVTAVRMRMESLAKHDPKPRLNLTGLTDPMPPEPDDDDEAAAQEVADMRLELELGYGFAPDEEKRAAFFRLLEMLKGGDVERVKGLGRQFGLFRPETLAEMPALTGPPAVQTAEQRRAQEELAAQRLAREVPSGTPEGEILDVGARSMVGGWGRALARGASERIAERRAQ